MRLTKEAIIADYNYFKSKAISYCQSGDIEKSAIFTELSARIGYKFSFKFSDDELEENIQSLGREILSDKIRFEAKENKIVFYDSFSTDNRNLTLQYLRAIFKWDSQLLYITSRPSVGKDILNVLNEYSKSTIFVIKGDSVADKIRNTAEAVILFEPSKVFLQYLPWDVIGFILWSQIKTTERFFINLTDHAYWLGKNTADYILEFRDYGYQLSINNRNISPEKLLLQPYYPLETNKAFEGFPIEKNNKIYAFAGSNYYKIYGKNFLFLKLMKEVLNKNPNLIFLFAGNGDKKPLVKFIKDNYLEDRFILIGERSDLSEVFKRIDIYVNTYPLIGGLMSQYAAIYNKPIIGYTDPVNYSFNDTEGLLGIKHRGLIVKSNPNEFIDYFTLLINNKQERDINIAYTKDAVITEKDFEKLLKQNIQNKTSSFDIKALESKLLVDSSFEIFYDMEVNYLKEYYLIIFNILKLNLFRCRPHLVLRSILGMAKNIKPSLSIIYKIFFQNRLSTGSD